MSSIYSFISAVKLLKFNKKSHFRSVFFFSYDKMYKVSLLSFPTKLSLHYNSIEHIPNYIQIIEKRKTLISIYNERRCVPRIWRKTRMKNQKKKKFEIKFNRYAQHTIKAQQRWILPPETFKTPAFIAASAKQWYSLGQFWINPITGMFR